MNIPNLVLPVFAVIVTGWLAGALGYVPRSLAGPLVQFAYNIAMPALVFLTIAQEPLHDLLDWRFLAAFGGGSSLCFLIVLLVARLWFGRGIGSSAMLGAAVAMTNTGFVALPILEALYGARGVPPAALATVFIAVVMFPASIILLEYSGRQGAEPPKPLTLIGNVTINPVVISTVLGLVWSVLAVPLPAPLAAYVGIFAKALTPCALFAIGLGFSFDELRSGLQETALVAMLKLLIVPLTVYGLCVAFKLDAFYTAAAVVCAAVPTAKTAYILAGEYQVEESMVASTISITTLASMATLLGWLYLLG